MTVNIFGWSAQNTSDVASSESIAAIRVKVKKPAPAATATAMPISQASG